MKIERVNEHQIRCTLTKEDLADRELKISELAYGSEKAKTLFRDMMEQASFECGFEAENIPLMIEAIPLVDCIVLVITKVEDPEELDTRFSKFAPSVHSDSSSEEEEGDTSDRINAADDILNLFKKLYEARDTVNKLNGAVKSGSTRSGASDMRKLHGDADYAPQSTSQSAGGDSADSPAGASDASAGDGSTTGHSASNGNSAPDNEVPNVSLDPVKLTKLYSFTSLDYIISFVRVLNRFYNGESSLYKDAAGECYTLVLGQGDHDPKDYNKICNIAVEYGREIPNGQNYIPYLEEHCELLIPQKAVQALWELA